MKREGTTQKAIPTIDKPMNQQWGLNQTPLQPSNSKKSVRLCHFSEIEFVKVVWHKEIITAAEAFKKIENRTNNPEDALIELLYETHKAIEALNNSILGPRYQHTDLFWTKHYEIRSSIFEKHLEKAMKPFKATILERFDSITVFVQYVLSAIERIHFSEPRKSEKRLNGFFDNLIWSIVTTILS